MISPMVAGGNHLEIFPILWMLTSQEKTKTKCLRKVIGKIATNWILGIMMKVESIILVRRVSLVLSEHCPPKAL